MKIPTMLLQRVLLDVGLQLSDTINRDYAEMHSRYQKEGMSFLTITLPTLDDALLRGLATGRLTRDMFTGFRAVSRRRNLPALLQGFFRRIFDDDGFVKEKPDVCAIYAIRQVTRLFKKVELPCSKPRVKAAYERYVSNDKEVDWHRHSGHIDSRLLRTISGFLWAGLEVFSGELYCSPGIFGPGATSERLNRNERHTIREWPERAEGSFPCSFHALHREDSDALPGITFLSEEEERPVRVVQVPKTLKTPRTISVEPSYMMLLQQSIAKPLMWWLESGASGFQSIRFTDQTVNKALARAGSLDGSLATIDLKDASDLVSNDLVKEIFRGPCPTFLNLIQDCRSTKAQLPDGSLLPLNKFASMGSALCFPVEAMVFFTIIMYALVKHSGRVPSRRLLKALAADVAVYGDDIIVPSSMAPDVVVALEAFGLRVNHDKSFLTGLFRESCGGDYYNGVDVTPAYVRHWDDSGTLSEDSHLVAYVSLSNTLYVKGLWHASQSIRDFVDSTREPGFPRNGRSGQAAGAMGLERRSSKLERRRRVRTLPLSQHPIGVLHYASYIRSTNLRWDGRACGYRVKGLSIKSTRIDDCPSNLDGFLHLAFSSRYFRERIHEYKNPVRRETATKGTIRGSNQSHLGDARLWSSHTGDSAEELYLDVAGVSIRVPGTTSSSWPLSSARNALEGSNHMDNLGSCGGSSQRSTLLQRRVFDRQDENHDGRSYAELVESDLVKFDRLEHLKPVSKISLYTSDRPHALCLKRGWTASQAGLTW
nr:MAG: hypothetical protein 3 [Leviviridae sp.]